MTLPATQSPGPAAWYPDPDDPRMLRYWDGAIWTRQIAPNPEPVPAHPYLAAVPTLPVREPAPAPHAVSPATAPQPLVTSEPVVASVAPRAAAPSPFLPEPFTPGAGNTAISVPAADVAYVPMSRTTPMSQPSRSLRHEGRSATLASWLYVFAPLLTIPFLWFGPAIDADSTWSVARVGLVGLAVVGSIVLAGLDQRALQRLGVPNAPSALVGIIPLIFVIDRTARVGRSGVAVLLLSLLVQGVVVAFIVRLLLPVLEQLA